MFCRHRGPGCWNIFSLKRKNCDNRKGCWRREEIERPTAKDMLEKLYDYMLSIMSPGPPYDKFYLDAEIRQRIIDKVEKDEIYASPDYLKRTGLMTRFFTWSYPSMTSLKRYRGMGGY
jgi:hypothetical protein